MVKVRRAGDRMRTFALETATTKCTYKNELMAYEN